MADKLSASEAVYGFAAWLTTRYEQVKISRFNDAGIVAELVGEFCRVNNLADPRRRWEDNLIHPPENDSEKFIIRSGNGYFLRFENDTPQMTTDPVEAKRLTLEELGNVMGQLDRRGYTGEAVRLRLAKIRPEELPSILG